ncbi:hypothetical protein [Helicobacter typhlonius]|nr:hypothetical protein [uncultured Helicobacter sp.]
MWVDIGLKLLTNMFSLYIKSYRTKSTTLSICDERDLCFAQKYLAALLQKILYCRAVVLVGMPIAA